MRRVSDNSPAESAADFWKQYDAKKAAKAK
jgi:hypothetical protein